MTSRARAGLVGLPAIFLLASGVGGCGPTQISPANRRIVESLATAVSARNLDWLAQNRRLIDERRGQGELSEAEARAFDAILERAGAGDWTEAERLAAGLRAGQRAASGGGDPAHTFSVRKPQQYAGSPPIEGRSSP